MISISIFLNYYKKIQIYVYLCGKTDHQFDYFEIYLHKCVGISCVRESKAMNVAHEQTHECIFIDFNYHQ